MSEWIEWKGGKCPVAPSDDVELTWNDGRTTTGFNAHLADWSDVRRYRILSRRRSEADLTPDDQQGAVFVGDGTRVLPVPGGIIYENAPGYEPLAAVLQRAYEQAAGGKGKERHAQGQPFLEQPMQELISLYGLGFALGQAGKKAQESQRLPRDKAVHELLGAIVYLAGAVIALEAERHD